MIQNFTILNAHNRSQISSIQFLQHNKIVSISHDFSIKIWNLRHLQLENLIKIKQSYLTSLAINNSQIIVGTGSGSLLFYDINTMKLNKTIKIHHDCINDIKFYDQIVTTSNDGTVSFIDPYTYRSPISQIQRYNSKYYLSGIWSFQLNQQFKIKQRQRINRYLTFNNDLYGINDEKGFHCISKKFNTYVPCQNMIQMNNKLIGMSWSTISIFTTYQDDDRIDYCSSMIPQIRQGDSILAMISKGKHIYAGSQCGNIYNFTINTDFHCYT